MITNIYFVRHAHSTYTSEELSRPLSERGLKDVKKVTKLLLEDNITHVISSPYRRAMQSVEDIVNLLGLNISVDDGFRERNMVSECH